VISSWSTERKPPLTSSSTASPSSGRTRTAPGRSTASTGWWPGSTPMSPSAAGAATLSASPDQTVRSAETISTFSGTPPPSPCLLQVLTGCARASRRSPVGSVQLGLQVVPVALEVLEATDVEERLLCYVIVLAVGDLAERLDGLAQRHGGAGHTGELLRHVGVLGQELLDPAGTVHRDLVLLGQLVDTEDGDDVLQLLVLLQDRLDLVGHPVVVLADVLRVQDPGGGGQRGDRGVPPARGDLSGELGGGVQVRERGRRSRVGVVVRGHVDRLQRGDRVAAGGGDPLLQQTHLVGQVGLVAHRRGHPPEQGGDLRAGLGEPEDVVDEQQHVLL